MPIWRTLPVQPPYQPQPLLRPRAQGASAPATTATLSGPTSGLVNVASTNFAVALDGTYAGTITPASDGAGTFSPASLSGPGTFTYTPTSTTGSPHHISITLSPVLTIVGSPISYAVTSGAVTYDLTNPAIGGIVGTTVYFRIEGPASINNNGGVNSWGSTQPDMAVHFRGTLLQIEAHCVGGSTCFARLSIDGVDQGQIAISTSWGWFTIGTGLDNTVSHDYLISFGTNAAIDQVRLTGVGVNTALLPARKLLAVMGDSVTTGQANTGNDSTLSYLHKAGVSLGWAVANRGIGSSGVVTNASDPSAAEGRTAEITALLPAPSVVLILDGGNDAANSVAWGISHADLRAGYLRMLQRIRANLPDAWIIAEAMIRNIFGGVDATLAPWNADISGAVSDFGDARCIYDTRLHDTYDPATDGFPHPDAAGCTKLAAAEVAAVQAALAIGGGGGGLLANTFGGFL